MQALLLFADNKIWSSLPSVDIWFFVICALIVVAIVVIYYLIPVFNKEKYEKQRANLEEREIAFKANRQQSMPQVSNDANVTNDTAEVDSQQDKDADV